MPRPSKIETDNSLDVLLAQADLFAAIFLSARNSEIQRLRESYNATNDLWHPVFRTTLSQE